MDVYSSRLVAAVRSYKRLSTYLIVLLVTEWFLDWKQEFLPG